LERGLVLAKQVLSQLSYTPYKYMILLEFSENEYLLRLQVLAQIELSAIACTLHLVRYL